VSKVPRRTMDEFVFLHLSERSIRDIVVEGDYDKSIVTEYLSSSENPNLSVWTIDSIEIDDDEVLRTGRDANNRERIIYLAKKYEDLVGHAGGALFIVDKDFADLTENKLSARDLHYTDYSCMEMYFYNERSLRRFLTVYCNRPDWQAIDLMECIQSTIQRMFAIRAAAEALGIRLNWIDRCVCLSVNRLTLKFDDKEFISRLLSKIGLHDRNSELKERTDSMILEFSDEPRNQIHGHDFLRVLQFVLRSNNIAATSLDENSIGRALALSTAREELTQEVLFSTLNMFSA